MRQSSAKPIHCVTNRQRLHTTAVTTKLHNNGFIFIGICFDYKRKDTKAYLKNDFLREKNNCHDRLIFLNHSDKIKEPWRHARK